MKINAISPITSLNNFSHSRANSTKTGEVTSDGLGLRKEAHSNSEVISKVSKGSTVNILGTEKGWARVNYNGKVGYLTIGSLKFNEIQK